MLNHSTISNGGKSCIPDFIYQYPLYSRDFIRSFFNSNNVWFRKSQGQHFLIDINCIEHYAKLIQSVYKGRKVLEIGGGCGHLSLILASVAESIDICELDNFFAGFLQYLFISDISTDKENQRQTYSHLFGDLKTINSFAEKLKNFLKRKNTDITVIHEDFMKFNFGKRYRNTEKLYIFGNIPYNISTKILEILATNSLYYESAVLTVQKEYFERMIGSKDRSYLTLFCETFFAINREFEISSNAFYPPPKVESVVFTLHPKQCEDADTKRFLSFVSQCFSSKRKMLFNNFSKNDKLLLQELLAALSLSQKTRAEELNYEQFRNLFILYSKRKAYFFNGDK